MVMAPTALAPDRLRFGHVDEASALVVNDYPYSWRVRTRIRYWIETTAHGDRFCSQTLNPRTERWNAPKRSTYTGVAVLTVDDRERVSHVSIRENDSAAWIDHFVEVVGRERLNQRQHRRLAQIIGYTRAMAHVRFRTVETTGWTPERLAEHSAEQARQQAALGRLIAAETRHAELRMARAGEVPHDPGHSRAATVTAPQVDTPHLE